MIDTAALRRLLVQATQGEWVIEYDFDQDSDQRPYPQWPTGIMAEQEGVDRWVFQAWVRSLLTEADCAFIAAAHNTMPALLDEIGRLRTFVAEKGVIFDSEMCDGDYRCLACFKRAYNEPEHVHHAPGCIVAEARQAQKEGTP